MVTGTDARRRLFAQTVGGVDFDLLRSPGYNFLSHPSPAQVLEDLPHARTAPLKVRHEDSREVHDDAEPRQIPGVLPVSRREDC